MLHEALFGAPVKGFSFEPVVSCFQEAVLRAKQEERQAILDALLGFTKAAQRKASERGFQHRIHDVFMGILADRAQMEHQEVTSKS